MTKRRDLVRELENAGFVQVKSGKTADHDKFQRDGRSIAVPRHREIKDLLADKIRKEAGLK